MTIEFTDAFLQGLKLGYLSVIVPFIVFASYNYIKEEIRTRRYLRRHK